MKYFTNINQNPAITVSKVLLFLLVVYCPLFLHLGDMPVRVWDEARLIANTLEMNWNGNFLVTSFEGEPDLWNTKPPLMIWAQLFFLKLIGNEELSFRLPSAIAGLLTSGIILLIFSIYMRKYWFGLMAVVVLVTANGYIGDHVVRTGDYDALLTLFTTFYALSFFLYAETRQVKYLHLFFAGVLLSVFTKSVQGLLFLPALGIYVMFSGNFRSLIRNKWLYVDTLLVAALIAGYYLLREAAAPGYLEAVRNNELGGRYLSTAEFHQHEFGYYLKLLISKQFGTWFLFVPLGIFAGLTAEDRKIRNLVLYLTLLSIVYFLIISFAGTKLAWYDAPLYPLLSMIAAAGIYQFFDALVQFNGFGRQWFRPVSAVLLFIAFFYLPYSTIIDKVYKPVETPEEDDFYTISHVLQSAANGKSELKDCFICYHGYNQHLRYYIQRLNEEKKQVFLVDPESLMEGYNAVYSQDYMRKKIEEMFRFETTGSYKNVKFIKINGIRNSND